jgi:hypothetical protein
MTARRTTAKPLFRTESIKDMLPVFVSGAETVIATLERVADSEPIDLQNLFMVHPSRPDICSPSSPYFHFTRREQRYTLDSIGLVGFGHDIGSLHRPVEFSYLYRTPSFPTVCRFIRSFSFVSFFVLSSFFPPPSSLQFR